MGIELLLGQGPEVGLARERAAQAADGVLDTALLPGAVSVAEEGAHGEPVDEAVMPGEFGSIVESDGAAERCGQC